jgi:hypothetical protein
LAYRICAGVAPRWDAPLHGDERDERIDPTLLLADARQLESLDHPRGVRPGGQAAHDRHRTSRAVRPELSRDPAPPTGCPRSSISSDQTTRRGGWRDPKILRGRCCFGGRYRWPPFESLFWQMGGLGAMSVRADDLVARASLFGVVNRLNKLLAKAGGRDGLCARRSRSAKSCAFHGRRSAQNYAPAEGARAPALGVGLAIGSSVGHIRGCRRAAEMWPRG